MASSASKGAHYLARTKKWIEDQGLTYVKLEISNYVFPPGRKPFAIKKDQLGADCMSVGATSATIYQVRGGKYCRKNLAQARRELEEQILPPEWKRYVILWEFRAREPVLIEVTAECKAA